MFEQTSRLAERLAASVSRRSFLGSLGGWAAAAALSVAGVLTGAGTARASRHSSCCIYCDFNCTCSAVLEVEGHCNKNLCPPSYNGCPLASCKAASLFTGCFSW